MSNRITIRARSDSLASHILPVSGTMIGFAQLIGLVKLAASKHGWRQPIIRGSAHRARILIWLESEGRAVIDIVRGTLLPRAGEGKDFTVWGHSQGGQAVLFAGMMASAYAPELSLLGVAAASCPISATATPRKRALWRR